MSRLEIWAWTTTPWTLPSNLALAVGPEVDYAMVRPHSGDRPERIVLLGANALEKYSAELGDDSEVLATVPGTELGQLDYTPLFDYFADHADSFRVLVADWVTDDDGTGVVHLAPGFGEDDQATCEAAGIELVVPVDDSGRFTSEVPDWAGQNVFDANTDIARTLRERGQLVRHDTYDHNYPHCWRTDTPIIYKAVNSWYVEVTALSDRLVELNQQINWIPGSRPRRPVRQVAGGRPRLVDQPQPFLGFPDPGVAVRRPRLPTHRRLRLTRRDRGRLRGDDPTTCTDPSWMNSCGPTPTTPRATP